MRIFGFLSSLQEQVLLKKNHSFYSDSNNENGAGKGDSSTELLLSRMLKCHWGIYLQERMAELLLYC